MCQKIQFLSFRNLIVGHIITFDAGSFAKVEPIKKVFAWNNLLQCVVLFSIQHGTHIILLPTCALHWLVLCSSLPQYGMHVVYSWAILAPGTLLASTQEIAPTYYTEV